MNELIKALLPYAGPAVFAGIVWYLQWRVQKKQKEKDRDSSVDATYVDSRFEFATASEKNLWEELRSIRNDLASSRREYIELLFQYVDLLIDCGKIDRANIARDALRRKLKEVRQEEKEKVSQIESKVAEHQQYAATLRGYDNDTKGILAHPIQESN